MPTDPGHSDPDRLITRLRRNPSAMPWPRRRQLASSLADELKQGCGPRGVALTEVLAADPKWEVRKQVAEVLEWLPEENAQRLGSSLSRDSSAYVARAARRALQRRQSAQGRLRDRRDANLVVGRYAKLQAAHGKVAAREAEDFARIRLTKLLRSLGHDFQNLLDSAAAADRIAEALAKERHRLAPEAAQVAQARSSCRRTCLTSARTHGAPVQSGIARSSGR